MLTSKCAQYIFATAGRRVWLERPRLGGKTLRKGVRAGESRWGGPWNHKKDFVFYSD